MAEWGDEWGELWGGAIAEITTHEDDAISRLKFHLSEKVNAEAMVGIFAERWQLLENLLSDLLTLVGLDAAFGDVQDKIGALLNLSRQGFDDDAYRTYLRAKAINLLPNRRTLPGLLELVRELLGPKTLDSLGGQLFAPDLATLRDTITGQIATATGTTYDAGDDAREFDGSSYLTWPNITDLTSSPFTFGYKVRDDVLATGAGHFRIATGDGAYVTSRPTGAVRAVVNYDAGTDVTVETTAGAIAQSVESHVTVTYDGSGLAAGLKIYIDGFEASYAIQTNGTGTQRALTGVWDLGRISAANLTGSLRDFIAYERELSAAEVRTLSNGGKRAIGYRESYPKTYILEIEDITLAEENIFRQFLRVARPATYNGTVLVIPDPAFGFSDATATVATTKLGFDNASGPPNFGGPYAHVLPLS